MQTLDTCFQLVSFQGLPRLKFLIACSSKNLTNSLLSLIGKKWAVKFPTMPTKHWLTSAVCSGRSLVVAGGQGEGDKYLSTVEVMDTETLQWSTASSLPHSLCGELAAICGDQVYMLGGYDQSKKKVHQVFFHLLTGCPSPVWPATLPGSKNEHIVISQQT